MFVLGLVLIAIGLVLVIPRDVLGGWNTNEGDVFGRYSSPRPSNDPDTLSPRAKLVRVLLGLGFMALGGLCMAFGS
jgi:drug/metabolite transporter (DMT)-like permease